MPTHDQPGGNGVDERQTRTVGPDVRHNECVGDYDLDRLGSREFEHMVQALAMAELGNGLSQFGDGRDGGREATFDGPVNFPVGRAEQLWDGYGVVQAKHRQSPVLRNNPEWLMGEIEKEIKGWEKRRDRGKGRIPEYLLVVSNVKLSPGEGEGRDHFDDEFTKKARRLNLKGWHVWSYTELRALLDKHAGIRQRYNAYIVSGDILEALADHVGIASTADIGRKLSTHAATQLVSKQWLRLGQAGYDGTAKLSLSRVAMDLPAVSHPAVADEPAVPQQIARAIIKAGDRPHRLTGDDSGFLLIAGPGQGKSTITQLVAHAYRLALHDGADLPVAQARVAASMRARLSDVGIPAPALHRWPAYVELAAFAEQVAGDERLSLVRYIASTIEVDGQPLKANQLLAWLKAWPWTLILDGLDEVPSVEVRERVLNAVNQFLIEAASHDADVFVIATTRPQGYNDEFQEVFRPAQYRLTPLSPEVAFEYGSLLVKQRLDGDDPDMAKHVRSRIAEAVRAPHTRELMTTPLQVTIMCAIAERSDQMPQTNYELLDTYYSTVFARERGTKAKRDGRLMNQYAEVINEVHEAVALQLQAGAQTPRSVESLISEAGLRAIIEERLRAREVDEAAARADDLVRIATDRLVLLVPRRTGQFGFEVRYLQEYMAARAIASGDDAHVLDRLDSLLPSAYWKFVWLLAAEWVSQHRQHLREVFVGRVQARNTESVFALVTLPGSRAAVELLSDGWGATEPGLRRRLIETALELLTAVPSDFVVPLRRVLEMVEADKISEMLIKQKLTDAHNAGTSSTADIVMSSWMKRTGPLGILARRLLGGRVPRKGQPALTARLSSIVRPAVHADGLPESSARELAFLLDQMGHVMVTVGEDVDERVALTARAALPFARHGQVVGALNDEAIREVVAGAVPEIDRQQEAAAVVLMSLLVEWHAAHPVSPAK